MATNATLGDHEGTEGGSIDVEKFLKDNKLTYVADKFKEKDVSIEELFEFSADELNEWAASDLGLDTLARKRLVKAVTKLKPAKVAPKLDIAPSHFGTISQSGAQPSHVIVSPEEHEAISKLYQRFDDTSNLIKSLESSFDLLEKSAIDCKKSLDNGFEEIINELKKKEESLCEECVIVGNEKKSKLLTQLESLKDYCKRISNGKRKYEEYIGDASMDIHKRKTTIVSMIDDIINNNNVCLVMVTQPKIGFPINQKQIDKFLTALSIDDCDQPFPPLLTIKKCGFTVIEIEWNIDNKQNDYQTSLNKNILEFAIEWVKVPKSNFQKIKSNKKDSSKKDVKSKKSNKKEKSKSKSKLKGKEKGKGKRKGKGKKHKKKGKSGDDDKKMDSSSDDDSSDSSESDDTETGTDSSDSDSESNSDNESSDSGSSDSDSEAEAIKRKLKSAQFEIDKESIEYDKLKWEEMIIKNKSKSKSKSTLKYKIKELKDETPYIVRMRCRNNSGWGNYCDPQICITKKLTISSKILKEKEKVYLLKILPKELKKKKFKLIYRASVDSFSSYKFHQKCDNKGATITIIRSTMNHVWGGYTSIPWSTVSNNYVNDNSAFIFLLRSTRGNAPAKWTIKNPSNAVYHNASYGPTFGGGFDFYLCDNCNTVNSSYANLGNSYNAPTDRNLLAGSYNFTVSDYEVYQLS